MFTGKAQTGATCARGCYPDFEIQSPLWVAVQPHLNLASLGFGAA